MKPGMSHNILKSDWERYREPVKVAFEQVNQLVAQLTTDTIIAVELLVGGCANTNYKISFTTHPPLVLRVYTRDGAALSKEMRIHELINNTIPMARMEFVDTSRTIIPYPCALFSYVEGILLRDLIFEGDEQAIARCSYEAGEYLAALHSFTFSQGGLFDEQFQVRSFKPHETYSNFAFELLKEASVKKDLGPALVYALKKHITDNQAYLPSHSNASLTHGDFDPANIKVMQVDGIWRISGILDWEFAFVGTPFTDIGLMLRYSHKIVPCYERAFINGIRAGGVELPPWWKLSAKMMDILCLLQIIHANPQRRRPIINSDALGLINYTLTNWEFFTNNS